jgi:hypothetical protein
MRSSFAPNRGVQLTKTPSHRQQMARRRWIAVGGMLALAVVSGAIGALTTRQTDPRGSVVETGPFSYFPYQ